MKPICAKCKLFYRIVKNGVYVEEGMPIDLDKYCKTCGNSREHVSHDYRLRTIETPPLYSSYRTDNGLRPWPHAFVANQRWDAYKLYAGDLWECKGCGAQLIIAAPHPIGEHYQPEYAGLVESFRPMLRVEDC